MKNYKTLKIEYPDLKTYLKNLQILSTTDFSSSSTEDIYHKFHDLALTIPMLGAKLLKRKFNGHELYRVRMEKTFSDSEDKNIIQTFSFPPSAFCNTNGRANIKNKSVFYCTDQAFPAIKESGGKLNEIGFLSIWKVDSTRDLVYTSSLPEVLPTTNSWEELGTYHHNFLIENQAEDNNNLLAHKVALRKLITDKFMLEKSPYPISSMLANEYLYHNKADLILYPSAQTFQDYTNFAIHPNVVLNNMRCTKIIKFKITEIMSEQVKFKLSMIGEVVKDRILWRKSNDQDGINLGFNKI